MSKKRDQQPELIIVGEEKAPDAEAPVAPVKPARIPMSFDVWWLLTQQKHKLKPELKQSVKAHLEARGFMVDENFDAGLKDFGIKT